jgi:hypothetical protein
LSLFNDIEYSAEDILAQQLLPLEERIYCASKAVAARYARILKSMKRALQEKPLSESRLRHEILGSAGSTRAAEQLRLLERILSISPSVKRLADGKIALYRWIESKDRSAGGRAEAALLHLGRPAHFREISKDIQTLFSISRGAHEHTIHIAVMSSKTFVRVAKGTYGLTVWGPLAKPRRRPNSSDMKTTRAN